jgi:two-component system LytT family response regulator
MRALEPLPRIRTIVVDDEPLARSNITTLLRGDPGIEVVCECGSGLEALTDIRRVKPDLVFLDVQMPECDGFDVLELLGADLPRAVVFVTAYDEYAVKAFEAGALDYLLKPFDNARFERTVDRIKKRLAQDDERPAGVERLAIKSAGRVSFIRIADIDWIEAADYYASLHVGPRTHLLRRSLSELEQDLDPARFCRVHRSSIVNLARVKSLTLNEDGEHDVILDDGSKVRLSRRYRKQLHARLGVGTSGDTG